MIRREADLLRVTRNAAQQLGWMTYHTHNSQHSEPGYPDLCLVHPQQCRIIFAELKTATGRVSPHQKQWLEALERVKHPPEVHLWRPADWDAIVQALKPRSRWY